MSKVTEIIEELEKEKIEILENLSKAEKDSEFIEKNFMNQNSDYILLNKKHNILSPLIILLSIISIISLYGIIQLWETGLGDILFIINLVVFIVLVISIIVLFIFWIINYNNRKRLRNKLLAYDKKYSKHNLLIRLSEIDEKINRLKIIEKRG